MRGNSDLPHRRQLPRQPDRTADAQQVYIEHPFDKMGRGNHFHGADDTKGSPFSKGRYNQYPGHFPEDFNGFN